MQGVRDDGSTFDVRIRVFPVFGQNKEKATRFIEVVEDITGKKNTEKALLAEMDKAQNLLKELKHNHEIMEKIFSSTEFSLAYLDKDFNFIRVNRSYADTGMQDTDFFIGKNHFALYPNEENESIFRSVVETGKTFSAESKAFTYPDQPDRGVTYWDWTLQPVTDDAGKVEGLILSLTDVTDRKQTEAMLQQAQKLESIGTLAGGIAHDFNNLLTGILGFTSLAMDDLPKDSTSYSSLEQVQKAGQQATSLVKQILSFSRNNDLEKKPLQLQFIIKEALKLIRGTLPSTIKITSNINEKCPYIQANPSQIHQIVMNLCTNAYHAMRDKGGKLNITLEELDVDSAHARQVPNLLTGKYNKLTISDTGHGIDSSILDRIYEPYFTTKKEGEGTGLGLSTTYGIVVSHGGAISTESQLNRGTTFHIYFPVAENDSPEPAEENDTPLPQLDLRVLFVDDIELNVLLGKEVLERVGCHVIGLTDSMKALDVFKASPEEFDVVVTDQTMPNQTGFELATKLLAIRPDLPIIMLTGHSDIVNEQKAKAIGIKEFLMKPLDLKKFINVVNKTNC